MLGSMTALGSEVLAIPARDAVNQNPATLRSGPFVPPEMPNVTSESTPAASEPVDLMVMTEAELASMRAEEGATVIERNGRFWGETFTGFFQPIHQLARLRAADVRRPTWRCWGYRAALVHDDMDGANGSIPVHLMRDLARFTERVFDESRRRDLRRCRREVEIRRLQDPEPFLKAGWNVYRSAKQRVPYGGLLSEVEYRAQMERRASDPRRLFIAGFVDGNLAGYLESYAVDGILYGRDLFVASDMMRTGIATGLYLETIEIGARAGTIEAICLGPVLLERPGLGWFKEGMGFPVVDVPAQIAIPAPIGAFIKLRRPAVHYRLTGQRGNLVSSTPASGSSEEPLA